MSSKVWRLLKSYCSICYSVFNFETYPISNFRSNSEAVVNVIKFQTILLGWLRFSEENNIFILDKCICMKITDITFIVSRYAFSYSLLIIILYSMCRYCQMFEHSFYYYINSLSEAVSLSYF